MASRPSLHPYQMEATHPSMRRPPPRTHRNNEPHKLCTAHPIEPEVLEDLGVGGRLVDDRQGGNNCKMLPRRQRCHARHKRPRPMLIHAWRVPFATVIAISHRPTSQSVPDHAT